MSWNSRTNRISIKWVNHNGWIDIFVIKKNFFCSYFRHISLCFYSNFDQESSLDAELNSASNKYSLGILLMNPAIPKTRNTWKNVMSTLHTFDRPHYHKNKKCLEKPNDEITFFRVFLVLGVERFVKSMYSGYLLDAEFNSTSNELSWSKFE